MTQDDPKMAPEVHKMAQTVPSMSPRPHQEVPERASRWQQERSEWLLEVLARHHVKHTKPFSCLRSVALGAPLKQLSGVTFRTEITLIFEGRPTQKSKFRKLPMACEPVQNKSSHDATKLSKPGSKTHETCSSKLAKQLKDERP